VKHPKWKQKAACIDTVELDWDGELSPSMFKMCMSCRVRDECLMEGLNHEAKCDVGVWGGTNVEERNRIRKGADPYQVWRDTATEMGINV
jgi:hypothetical protein